VIRCDVAALRIFGVSLAGWNAVASLFIALMSARAAIESLRAR
jgi:disulfide bond formation protein DsbB